MSLAILQLLKKKCKTPMGCVSSKEGKTTVKLLQIHLLLSEKKKKMKSLNLIGKEEHY